MTHTPGPWLVEEGHIQRDSGGIRYWQITDGQDAIACNQFCYAGSEPKTNEANAHLIAAAPELFAALEFIAHVARLTPGFSLLALKQADAALSKADGL